MIEKETLIVGADDSNHAGTSKGEIIVVVFSFLYEDSLVKIRPNNRNYNECLNWLENLERDYRFTILTGEKYRHSSSNLITISPKLIENFLEEKNLIIKNLKIYLDGRLGKGERNGLKKMFRDSKGIEDVVVDNFIKKNLNQKGRVSKRPYCPSVVYYADILSNYLYSQKTFEELSKDSRLISIK